MTALVGDLQALIECESPSDDLAAVRRSADLVAAMGERLFSVAPERIEIDGRSHVRWQFGAPRVLVLAHHDTVWPIGTIDRLPFSNDGSTLRGPGAFDMKAGLAMAFHAIADLADRDGLCLLVTGDEELGSPSSRQLIEDTARGCDAVFVLEASADGGALKIGRKGVSLYRVIVTGKAAHAGLEPHNGVNASIEAAHVLLQVAALGDEVAGTTVVPTVISGGTTTNTVPARAEFAVDVRVKTLAEQARVDEQIRAIAPTLPGASIVIEGGANRPPMEPSAAAALFSRAERLARELDLTPFDGVSVGGASDGNFTAGIGVPTLDGLGAVGGGAHADHEHVIVAMLAERTTLLRALIVDVLASGTPDGHHD